MPIAQEKLEKLIKVMSMTTSSNDGEALNAVRMANKLIKADGLDWRGVLAMPIKNNSDSAFKNQYQQEPPPRRDYTDDDINEAFSFRHGRASGSSGFSRKGKTVKEMFMELGDVENIPEHTQDFLTSLYQFYQRTNRLTDKQYVALKKVYNEYR